MFWILPSGNFVHSLYCSFVPYRKDGNSWSSGPAPPAPPGSRSNRHRSGNRGNSDSNSGSGKSGVSAGAIVGIIIAILVVIIIVGFFIFKRRIRRPSSDLEKVDINKPFVVAASNDMEGNSAFLCLCCPF